MTNQIVNVVVSQQVAPAPSTLQRTGALVSQGATTLTTGSVSLLTQLADLTPLLRGTIATTSVSYATGTVTVVLASNHTIPSGDTVQATISGVLPAGYNGTFDVTYASANSFTYTLGSDPGVATQQGVYTLEDVAELTAMATTFFAQGVNTSVYVLELGTGTPAQGVTALTSYINDPTVQMYGYLVPRNWDTETTFKTLVTSKTALTAKLYFWITTTLSTYTNWTGLKSAMTWIENPDGVGATEFDAAADFYVTLNYNPTAINKVPPNAFAFIYGVTAWNPTGPQQTALKAAHVNWVSTGAEGGISNTLVKWGTTEDGRDFTYWYSVDWVQVQMALQLTNAIINGSNNPQNPLYYNQQGINRLQAVAQGVMNAGVSFGLVNGNPLVTAIPYNTYVTANPSDYPAGIYNGLAVTYTPNRGFISITFYVTVTDFPAA